MASLSRAQLNRLMERIETIRNIKHEEINHHLFGDKPPLTHPTPELAAYWHREKLTPFHKNHNPDEYHEAQRESIEAFNSAYLEYHMVAFDRLDQAAKAVRASAQPLLDRRDKLIKDFDDLVQEMVDRIIFLDKSTLVEELNRITKTLQDWKPSKS